MVGVVSMPEQMIEKLKKNILPQWKTCLITALIVGLITHVYKITNWIPNWDSLVFRYDAQNMLSMGRWFLPVACGFSSFYDLPWLTGLLAILFHALGAVCILKILDVQKKTTAALVGALVVSFPTVTSVMLYQYVSDGYSLSFLLSCLAVVFMTNKKPRYVLSAVLIALSVGIYQAYITTAIMLLIAYFIFELLYRDKKISDILKQVAKCALAGGVGMGLYYVIWNILLKMTGTEILAYQGMESAASLSGLDIRSSLYTIKHSFTDYFFNFADGVQLFDILNVIIIVFTVVFYVVDIIKEKISPIKLLLVVICAAVLPVGASMLAFVNGTMDYHNLMKMGFLVFYLFFLLAYDQTTYKSKAFSHAKAWMIFIVMFVLLWNQAVIANVSYHKLEIAYEKSFGTLIRIADRIEEIEGTQNLDRVLVIGALSDSEAYSVNLPPDMTGTTDGYILRADDEIVHQSVLCSALNDYAGKNYRFVHAEEKQALLLTDEVQNMGFWPEKNAIAIIDDAIVIKLGTESE